MDALAILQEVSQKQGIDGPIAEAMAEAAYVLGDGVNKMEQRLQGHVDSAPGNIAAVAGHILEIGGKRIRPAICLLSYKALGGQGSPPIDLAVSCELLHNASLLHDDVIDEGDVRRGKSAARMVWGNAISILGGDYLLMRAVETVAAMGPEFMPKLVDTMRLLVEGEITQLRLRGSLKTTPEEYFEIIEGKTASLFRFAGSTGALAAPAGKDSFQHMGEFGWHIGIAFQLIDDVLDFSADSSVLGKNLLADIGQGKITLPVICAAAEDLTIYKLLAALVNDGDPDDLAPAIAQRVSATKAIELVKTKAAEHTDNAVMALSKIQNGDSEIIDLLKKIAFALLKRQR